MPRIGLTVSPALLADLDLVAERDAPGAPNRSATALRLMARALTEEKARLYSSAVELRTTPGWAAAAAAAVAQGVPEHAVEAIGRMRVPEAPGRLDGALVAGLARAWREAG